MKYLRQTRHTFKHRQPGKVLSDQIPAYNSSGLKTYVRHLPPMRDQKQIDTRLLCSLINKRTEGNCAVLTPSGIKLNQNDVMITEGMASCEMLRFRFIDLWDFLMNLRQEKLLHCDISELKTIKKQYFETIN